MGRAIYSLVGKISGVKDPFKEIKGNSNKFALKLYPELKKEISNSEDRLLAAVKLSIIGNIIDYGAKNSLNVAEEIDSLFKGILQLIMKVVQLPLNIINLKKA